MDIVVLTAVDSEQHPRMRLLVQTLESLTKNIKDPKAHTLTLAFDGPGIGLQDFKSGTIILNGGRPGASACRNIAASSIPKYRRQEWVMFLDDDVYMVPDWDSKIERSLLAFPETCVISGYSHPFNHSAGRYSAEGISVMAASVLSTVNMAMPWNVWDEVGFFVEPGGPGGSEDVDWCARAEKLGYGFAVTDPQCVIHTGMHSSSGEQIVGHEQLAAQNQSLLDQFGLNGKVIFG